MIIDAIEFKNAFPIKELQHIKYNDNKTIHVITRNKKKFDELMHSFNPVKIYQSTHECYFELEDGAKYVMLRLSESSKGTKFKKIIIDEDFDFSDKEFFNNILLPMCICLTRENIEIF